jgi:hypothetical protein
MNKVFVIGVGMSKFVKPENHKQSYIDFGKQAVQRALDDFGIKYDEVEQAFACYVLESSCAGQKVFTKLV